MELISLAYVAFGGAIGSVLRFISSFYISRLLVSSFPYSTFFVNIFGSLMMGVVIALIANLAPDRLRAFYQLFAVGVLGGFTTFSTFSYDSYMLIEKGLYLNAAFYICGSVIISIAALFIGMWLVKSLT